MPRIGGSRRAQLAYQPEMDEDAPRPREDIVVELDDYRHQKQPNFELRGDEAFEAEDEAFEAEDETFGEAVGDGDFKKNLALDFDEKFLDAMGEDIVERVVEAIEEHQPSRDRFERGLEMMGLVESDLDDGPFPGASNAVHPLLAEAITQFWARCMGELFPPEGCAKGKVEGKQTQQLTDRAERVAEYMNFSMRKLDRGYIHEKSRLVWGLPAQGSYFSKTFRDHTRNRNVTVSVAPADLIVPSEATDLDTTPFFAHRMRKTPNEIKRLMISKFYRHCDLDLPTAEEDDPVETLRDEVQDTAPDADHKSVRHELFETCIEWDLEGDEHVDDEDKETGLERSYYITVDRHTRKVLSIYRGWDQNDVLCNRKVYFRHYKFVPGPKFYGLGFFHLIGGLQIAATGSLRVLLDSAASASLSGGFVSKHANLKGKRLILTPGHWEPVDVSAEDLQKAFYSPPVKEPAAALFQLLSFLVQAGEKFSATTELQTGDANPQNAPVGTTNMMLEQGGKVPSAIHRMMCDELDSELCLRYELDREFAPAEGYPYDVADQQRTVYADDFAPGVSIEPVADPNIVSSSQRIAMGQTILQTTMQTGVGDMKKAVRRLYKAMRVPDVDDLIPADVQPMAYDPVGEIQALLMGKAVMVTPEQPHVMHLQVLAAFASNPQQGGNEQVQKQIGPQLLSIMGQHLAYSIATHARGLGVPVGYMNPQNGQVTGGQGTPEQIAAMLAQVAPQLATVPGMPPIPEPGKGGEGDDAKAKLQLAYAELDLKKQEHQQDMQMQREKHDLELMMQKSKLEAQQQMDQAKVQIAVQKGQNDMKVAEAKSQQAIQQGEMDAQIKQQTSQQQMAHDQQSMDQKAQMQQREMHQKHQMGQQQMAHEQQMGNQKIQQGAIQNEQKLAHTAQQQEAQAVGGQQPVDKLQHLRPHQPPHGSGADGGV